MKKTDSEKIEKDVEEVSLTVKIKLVKPGALSCGQYIAGVVYEVNAAEAEKLISVKGFELITDKEG